MCTLNSCCCFSLRTGSLIIGWLGVVGSFLQIFDNTQPKYEGIIKCVAYLITYAALLYGIYAQRPSWMLLGIVLSVIATVITIIIGIIAIIYFGSDNSPYKKEERSTIVAMMAIAYTIGLALGIYFTSVLYSFYKQLKENGGNPSRA